MFITVLIAVIFRFTDFIQKLLLHLKLPFLKTNIYSFCFYMYDDKFVYFGNVDVFWPKFIWKLKNIRKLNNTMINWYVTFCYFYLFFNGKFKLWCQLDSLVKWLLEFLSMSWWQILSQNFLIIICLFNFYTYLDSNTNERCVRKMCLYRETSSSELFSNIHIYLN